MMEIFTEIFTVTSFSVPVGKKITQNVEDITVAKRSSTGSFVIANQPKCPQIKDYAKETTAANGLLGCSEMCLDSCAASFILSGLL